jgi:hypothetical protein
MPFQLPPQPLLAPRAFLFAQLALGQTFTERFLFLLVLGFLLLGTHAGRQHHGQRTSEEKM